MSNNSNSKFNANVVFPMLCFGNQLQLLSLMLLLLLLLLLLVYIAYRLDCELPS